MRALLVVALVACAGCGDRVPPGTKGTSYDPAGEKVHMLAVSFMPEGKSGFDELTAFLDPGDELLVLADPSPSNKQDGAERSIEVRVLSGAKRGFVGAIKRRFFVPAR